MGNQSSASGSEGSVARAPETVFKPEPTKTNPSKKKEFIIDNSFRKSDDMFFAREGGNKLIKSMTFDDRRLLSVEARKLKVQGAPALDADRPMLKRAVTFVNKSRLERRISLQLSDVMYRKHFSFAEKGRSDGVMPSRRVRFETPEMTAVSRRPEAVAIVDVFSTGAMVAYRCFLQGYHVVNVSSTNLGNLMDMMPDGLNFKYSSVLALDHANPERYAAIDKLHSQIVDLPWPVKAVLAGAETGVELADELSSRMGLRTNGTAQSSARRNKVEMGRALRAAGIRTVHEREVRTWAEIEDFLQEWKPKPFRVVAKPTKSAGSEDVTLCGSLEELQAAFGKIIGKKNLLGIINESVLIQEYLEGTEYVVDMVSRDGEHKVAALWKYDRRPANGASFVCHGQRMLVAEDNIEKYNSIIDYQKRVISALGIINGPSHGEIKWCMSEPVLVEVASRCHGGDGLWVDIAEESVGVSQVQSCVDAYLGEPSVFASMTSTPQRRKHCAVKWLVNSKLGLLRRFNSEAVGEIKAMKSYRGHQFFAKAGKDIKKTENCFSWAGCVQLCNDDEAVMDADYRRIEELQNSTLFDVEVEAVKEKYFVAVVDPFSTGANLAADIFKRGFSIIAIYSGDMDKLDKMQNLIPEGIDLKFEAITGFNESLPEMVKDLSRHGTIVAVVAGAETGVELADQISSYMGLRTNGTEKSVARRNKFVMGETIRKAGIRAVKQLQSSSWEPIVQFIKEWNPNPFKVIVKPMESAGGEDVTLCHSIEEVQRAYNEIYGKKNSLGLVNSSVLVQEYLEGTEYVVDMVSRDGVHKVIAIWEYDKRPINGSPFVMFGERLQIISDNPAKFSALIEYQKKVCTALGIFNGPSHGEVKWFKDEPILVEVGARCHGGEGSWMSISDATLRCNQVTAAVASYLSQEAFDSLPDAPLVRYGDGRLLCLVVRTCGRLVEINAELVEEIRQMKSFSRMELFLKPGQNVVCTTNCFTLGGVVILIHPDLDTLSMDYTRVHEMENENLFICE